MLYVWQYFGYVANKMVKASPNQYIDGVSQSSLFNIAIISLLFMELEIQNKYVKKKTIIIKSCVTYLDSNKTKKIIIKKQKCK